MTRKVLAAIMIHCEFYASKANGEQVVRAEGAGHLTMIVYDSLNIPHNFSVATSSLRRGIGHSASYIAQVRIRLRVEHERHSKQSLQRDLHMSC